MAEKVVSWIMLLSKLSRTEVFARKRIILIPWKKELARRKGFCDESEMVTISGHQDVHINDEKCLLKALAHQPLRVAIDASAREFQFYSGDVFDGRCGVDLDHDVAAVGYGSSKGSDYIIVKNYWGPRWGEKIYIRVKRNSGKPEGLNQ
uniref:Peptidase C1A papain C-terminal domain-containing protein n=1 Tax=Brassica oleracea var. oleracea TaxID=109376 RepID=A0A0D3BRL6_BRAOL